MNPILEKLNYRFQSQAYDHVLRDEAREHGAVEQVAEYIARNPERQRLVGPDEYAKYGYTGSLVPGYPELKPFDDGYWERFWHVYSHLIKNGLQAKG